MKTAVIIHGLADSKEEYLNKKQVSESNRHWMPWLQQQLISKGILAQTPEMPNAYAPEYKKWSHMFEHFDINEDTVLVGHSCGGGFLVRWLSEHKVKVGKVALVAPWLDPERRLNTGMFDFEIDSDIASRTDSLTILVSTDDHPTVLQTVETLKAKLKGFQLKELTGKGHFTLESMKTENFPNFWRF